MGEIVRNLGGEGTPDQASPTGATRGWTVKESASGQTVKNAAAVNSKGPRAAGKAASSAYSETRIQFEFGSDRLTAETLKVLDIFAEAIKTPKLANATFVIEGHTDGIGSDSFNLDLSRRRAEAVVRYMVTERGVDPKRLVPVGKGKSELAVTDPGAGENRRVVWITQN